MATEFIMSNKLRHASPPEKGIKNKPPVQTKEQ